MKRIKRGFALLMAVILCIMPIADQVAAAPANQNIMEEKNLYKIIKSDDTIKLNQKSAAYATGEEVTLKVDVKKDISRQIEVMNVETKELLLVSADAELAFTMPDSDVKIDITDKNVIEKRNEENLFLSSELAENEYQKVFRVNGKGVLQLLDADGKLLAELADGEEKTFDYATGSKDPAEVQVKAMAASGYQVSAYEIKWLVKDKFYPMEESKYEINAASYERGHYLRSAAFDEVFEVSFEKEGENIKKAAYKLSTRAAADINNPKVGDVYTGSAYVVYDGYPDRTYNGSGYIVPTSGDFIGDSIIMSTCASGHNYWAPQTGQTGSYTITVTGVDTTTGTVTCSVYWTNDFNYAYQNLSSTYTYRHDFSGDLSIAKGMSDSLSAFIYPYGFRDNLDLRATFGIYSDSDAKSKVAEIKTNQDGEPIKDGVTLSAGTYFVKELIAPKGFALNKTIYKIVIGAGATRNTTIKDQIYRARVKGVKIDALTGTAKPTSGLSLEGAEYSVYGNAACTDLITKGRTDSNGTIEFDCVYFAYGTYYIRETKAPKNYQLDTKIYKVDVNESLGFYPNSQVRLNDIEFTSKEVPEPGIAKIKKVSANPAISEANSCYSLAGGEFQLTNVTTGEVIQEILVTKANGETQEVTLNPGKYRVKELKAPKGFIKSTENPIIEVKSNQPTVYQFENVPLDDPILIILQKKDSSTGNVSATGSGTFKNAEYRINYYDGYYKSETEISGKKPLRSWVLATNSSGVIVFEVAKEISGDTFYLRADGLRTIPLGTITIQETRAPIGYKLDSAVYIRNIEANSNGDLITSYQVPESPEPVIRGGIQIEKWDQELDERQAQGAATLQNTSIQIINRSKNAVYVEGTLYAPGKVVKTITTDADGMYQSSNDFLPYGDYEAKEVVPPVGYTSKGKQQEFFSIRKDKEMIILTGDKAIKNVPIRGGVQIEKWDRETNNNKPQGGATLLGTELQIINRSKYAVLVEGSLYQPGEVIKTVTTDEAGRYRSDADLLPYGDYEAVEVTPPKGYLPTGKLQERFEIRENGIIVELTDAKAIKNDPIRGDIKGVKVSDDDQKRLANVPFQITSITTGEKHIVVTDENGMFNTSSEWNPHSRNTNQGKTSEDGIWFGTIATLDDTKGALLYDRYLIEELPCEANKDKVLIPAFAITVNRNMTTIDLGTLTNDYVPLISIATKAADYETKGNYGQVGTTTHITDAVSYVNLVPDTEYTLKGILMDQATGKELLVKGKPVTAEQTFKAVKAHGTISMDFFFDSIGAKGKEVVIFESLYQGADQIAVHTDLGDKEQTIRYEEPELKTTATDQETGDHVGYPAEVTTITDQVRYKGLLPGKEYTVKGILMDKGSGKALLVDGKEIRAEKKFSAAASSGSVELTFIFDSSVLQGKKVVAFERLYYEKIELAVHTDLEDEDQTVEFQDPKLKTTARDQEIGGHSAYVSKQSTIVDQVSYTGLLPGKEYTIKGVLMDKASGKPLLIDGKEVQAEKKFIAAKANASIELAFPFDSSNLQGKSVVVFEHLYHKEREIAAHADLEDQGQTVTYQNPKLKTTAADQETAEQVGFTRKQTRIVDEVQYSNLIPDQEYTIQGILMDKGTGQPLLVHKKEVRAEKRFTASSPRGSIKLTFVFDSSALKGKRIVVFESLYDKDRKIAVHADLEDADQTVDLVKPMIKTTASEKNTGKKEIAMSQAVTIVDVIAYEGLIPGKEYLVQGILMDKESKQSLLINKKEVTVEKKFKPEKSSGQVEMEFTFDAVGLAGKEVVIFEKIFFGKREVAVHQDINDTGQTVKFYEEPPEEKEPPKQPPTNPKTGDSTQIAIYVILSVIVSTILGYQFYKKKKNKKNRT